MKISLSRVKMFKYRYFLLLVIVILILSFFLVKYFVIKDKKTYLSGVVKQIDSDRYKIMTKALAENVEITNSRDFPKQFLNIPAEFRGKITNSKIEITDVKSIHHESLAENIESLPEEKYQRLNLLLNELENLDENVADPVKALLKNGDEIISEIKKSYRVASRDRKNAAEMETLVEAYKTAIDRQELYSGKAYYLKADNYIPEVYQEIYDHSRGSAAIFRKTESSALCSGVLIAENKILTCLHCTKNVIYLSDLVVKFGYEENSDGSTKILDEYPVLKIIAKGDEINALKQRMDFVILEAGRNTSGKLPGDNWPIQSIAIDQTILLDDAVYVIGYPNGERKKVHDNSYVYWPFEINESTYNELELRIKAEFLGNKKLCKEAMREFENSYKEVKTTAGEKLFYNFSTKWNNMPTIGVNCSTSHGNSGSPLYLKRKEGVIGILFNGSDDSGSYVPGWKYHEAILPIKEISKQLDRLCPNWKTVWNGVRIK